MRGNHQGLQFRRAVASRGNQATCRSYGHQGFPDKFGPALRAVLAGGLLTPFALKASDYLHDGNYPAGLAYASLAFLIIAVAVKWKRVEALFAAVGGLAKSKTKLISWSLLGFVAIASAFALGTFVGRRESLSPAAIGNIVWDFEQTANGSGYFLSMTRLGNQEMRVLGFQAHGKNISNKATEHLTGYVRSEVTNVQLPIYLLAQAQEDPKPNVCYAQTWVPTVPQETFGLPPFADFQLATFSKPVAIMESDGSPISKFMNDFVPFTIVLEYDGTRYERRFSKEEVQRQVSTFERSLNPQSSPHVTGKLDAKPPPPFPLQLLIPPDAPKAPPSLASPIPLGALPKLPAN
jgi:hypothetical protein